MNREAANALQKRSSLKNKPSKTPLKEFRYFDNAHFTDSNVSVGNNNWLHTSQLPLKRYPDNEDESEEDGQNGSRPHNKRHKVEGHGKENEEERQEVDVPEDLGYNLDRIQKLESRMVRKWILQSGKTVEDTILQRLRSDPGNLPYILASFFILDPDDHVWEGDGYFTKAELDEIRATVRPVHLDTDSLENDEKEFMDILAKLRTTDGRRLDLPFLQEKYDRFKPNFDGLVHRKLLIWMDTSLGNFVWNCEQSRSTIAPPEVTYGHNIWGPTCDRMPIPGTTLWR